MSVFRSRPPSRNDGARTGSVERAGELWSQLEHVRAVFRMTSALNSSLNYERVLDMALDAGAAALSPAGESDNRLVSALLLFDGDRLRNGSSRGLSASDQRAVFA